MFFPYRQTFSYHKHLHLFWYTDFLCKAACSNLIFSSSGTSPYQCRYIYVEKFRCSAFPLGKCLACRFNVLTAFFNHTSYGMYVYNLKKAGLSDLRSEKPASFNRMHLPHYEWLRAFSRTGGSSLLMFTVRLISHVSGLSCSYCSR